LRDARLIPEGLRLLAAALAGCPFETRTDAVRSGAPDLPANIVDELMRFLEKGGAHATTLILCLLLQGTITISRQSSGPIDLIHGLLLLLLLLLPHGGVPVQGLSTILGGHCTAPALLFP